MSQEIRDIRVLPQDFQMTGTAVTFGLTYAARIYDSIPEALLNPKLFLNVADRIRAGDRISLFHTNKGHKAETVIEMVDLVVKGFKGREPQLFQRSPIWRMQDEAAPLASQPEAPVRQEDPRDTLTIVTRETGQGRGKPKLISWDVADGTGVVLKSFSNEEAAQNYVRDFSVSKAA